MVSDARTHARTRSLVRAPQVLLSRVVATNKSKEAEERVQCILISATLSNPRIFETWLRARVVVSSHRPAPLSQYVAYSVACSTRAHERLYHRVTRVDTSCALMTAASHAFPRRRQARQRAARASARGKVQPYLTSCAGGAGVSASRLPRRMSDCGTTDVVLAQLLMNAAKSNRAQVCTAAACAGARCATFPVLLLFTGSRVLFLEERM